MSDEVRETVEGEGYTVGHVDAMGDGPGFRKVRRELGVTAFGVNAIAMPAGYEASPHYHEEQEELYFVHRGVVEIVFGNGDVRRLGPGGLARVDPGTVRHMRNVGDEEAVYVCIGAKDGYVGRDGRQPDAAEAS